MSKWKLRYWASSIFVCSAMLLLLHGYKTDSWLLAIVGAVLFFAGIKIEQPMKEYWARPCGGFAWRRYTPDASKDSIRKFLNLFCVSFALPEENALCLRPDDKLLDIYKVLTFPGIDSFEFENLTSDLQTEYGLDLNTWWEDNMTLGDLFTLTQKPA